MCQKLVIVAALLALGWTTRAASTDVVDIGSRLEPMIDGALVDRAQGAELRMHEPVPREIVLVHDAPWEGSGSGYHSVFQDGALYRMYYKSWQHPAGDGPDHANYLAYAESRDGIHWVKPDLGLISFAGSTKNNIVMADDMIPGMEINAVHVAVFKDDNPGAAADARYKAIVVAGGKKRGLYAFKSADALRFVPMSDRLIITQGAFDSQNLAFWDPVRRQYRAYFRDFADSNRGIKLATSDDFLHWSDPVWLTYPGAPVEQLYTNQIKPYYRAPHILIGFPARYVDRGWSDSMRALPEPEHRAMRGAKSRRYGTAITDALLMTSRDGVTFHRWPRAFVRPGLRTRNNWVYGDNYVAWHLVETESAMDGAPRELSLYATESYWTGRSSELRRYTLRIDGFASMQAPLTGGEFVTKPLRYAGNRLLVNFATSAAGSLRVELLDASSGMPIPGFAMGDCPELFGDALEREVRWTRGGDVGSLAGRAIRIRVALRDADLFAFRFR